MRPRLGIRGDRTLPALLATLVCLCIFSGEVSAQVEPDRTPSYAIDAEAVEFVGRHEQAEWMEDATFVAALEELAASDLSAEARADAFALMQDEIGWLFVGVMRLFPGRNYQQTVAMQLTTYIEYQQRMPGEIDVEPLLGLAKSALATHSVRASNALLLATMLNPKAAVESVREAIDLESIGKAEVPAIALHNLALATALSLDPENVRRLVALLPEVKGEEEREDILAVVSIYRIDAVRDAIEAWVKATFPGEFDQSVQTALATLAQIGPVEHFTAFYKSLGEGAEEADVTKLRDFWDGGFLGGLGKGPPDRTATKVWDGFTITVHEDGAEVTDGKAFHAWIRTR